MSQINIAEAGVSDESPQTTGPHLIRITDSGKIRVWVSFALSFLEANADRPIVFHTLPATHKQHSQPSLNEQNGVTGDMASSTSTSSKSASSGSRAKATSTVPRLVSVVEIVKREFIKSLEAKHSSRLAGLHQYNEIGCLEDHDPVSEDPQEENRAAEIARALSGNHVKQKQTPYMKITLSNTALPELVAKGATYQPPVLRKLSKSAKMRMKKRERGAKHATSGTPGSDSDAIVPD